MHMFIQIRQMKRLFGLIYIHKIRHIIGQKLFRIFFMLAIIRIEAYHLSNNRDCVVDLASKQLSHHLPNIQIHYEELNMSTRITQHSLGVI